MFENIKQIKYMSVHVFNTFNPSEKMKKKITFLETRIKNNLHTIKMAYIIGNL